MIPPAEYLCRDFHTDFPLISFFDFLIATHALIARGIIPPPTALGTLKARAIQEHVALAPQGEIRQLKIGIHACLNDLPIVFRRSFRNRSTFRRVSPISRWASAI